MAEEPEGSAYQSLYRRFRPSTFAEVRGQDHVVLALRNAVRDGRVAHAYLFSGPRGTGKTSTARILAKALNCTDLTDGEPCGACPSCIEIARGSSLDVHELDAASNNGVDAMRDLVSRAALGTPGRQKVYIVDEVHMLSTAASNALLKTLEEPPAHVIFVLATTDPQKVLPTIRSRTQHFEFRLIGPEVLGALLDQVRSDAGLDLPDEALDLAVRRGRGSARDALSVLDQVAASDTLDDDLPELGEIVEALADRDVGRAMVAVAQLTAAGYGAPQLAGDLVDHLRQGFLALVAPDLVTVASTERDVLVGRAQQLGLAALVRALEVLGRAQVTMKDAPDPRVNLEVALVRLAHPELDEGPEALLARIERLESRPAAAASGSDAGPNAAVASPARPGAASSSGAAAAPALEDAPATDNPATANPATATRATAASGPRKTVGALRRERGTTPDATVPDLDPSGPPAGPAPDLEEAAAPAPTPPPAADVPAGPAPSRDALVQAWGDHILGRLRPKAKALFQAGRFVDVEEDRARFGLPNETHRLRCEDVRAEVEAALSDHFGSPVRLTLVVDPGAAADGTTDPATTDPAITDPAGSGTSPPAARRPSSSRTRGGAAPRRPPEPTAAISSADEAPPEDDEDLASFDPEDLGEVADVDNSAESRVLQAFPGAEEVT